MAKQGHTGTFIFGAIVGGVAAAGFTLWKTPRSGASLRAMLAEQAEGMLDRVTSLGEHIGIETGPDHEYPAVSTPASATRVTDQVVTTIEPGEGPIADDRVLPVSDEEAASASN